MPMRNSMRRSAGKPELRSTMAFCTSMAQRTASTTLRNSTSAPSPVRFTTRPLCTEIVGSMRSLRSALSRASVRSSSAPVRRLNPTTSAARTAASLRVSAIVPLLQDSNSTMTRSESPFSENKRPLERLLEGLLGSIAARRLRTTTICAKKSYRVVFERRSNPLGGRSNRLSSSFEAASERRRSEACRPLHYDKPGSFKMVHKSGGDERPDPGFPHQFSESANAKFPGRFRVDREHLPQHVSSHPVSHQGGEMRLKLIQLRRRAAIRWPTMAGFVAAAPGTAKAGKPHRDLAEKRRDRMVPVILHSAHLATASAVRPPDGVARGLRRDDLLLEAGQQQLPFGQGQP